VEIDLDAADFSVPHLQSMWRRLQELVQSKQPFDKALLHLSLQQTLNNAGLACQIHLERLDALVQDPAGCAAQVQDLARRRRAEAELAAAGEIIYRANGRGMADLAASAARLQKLALPRRSGGPSTETSWSAADLLAAEMQRANVLPLLNDLVCEGKIKKEAKQGKEQPYRAARGNAEGAPEGRPV
jgi:hypothetical protein